MPAATLDPPTRRWRTTTGSLFNPQALAKVFRGKLLAVLQEEGLSLPAPRPGKWVVDCKRVGNGEKALISLGRDLYRGVLRESDLRSCENGQLSFRYRDSQSGEMKVRTLPGTDFLRLPHVLPKGFRRARNDGFLHPNRKSLIALLHLVLKIAPRPSPPDKPRPAFPCPCGGMPRQVIRRRIPAREVKRRSSAQRAETAG